MRYLQHKKTGRKFAYTEILARHPDLKEVGTDTAPKKAPQPAETAEPARQEQKTPDEIVTESGAVRVGDADKDALATYAERHFGTKLDKRKSQADLTDQVRELIKTHGHPDFD